MLNNTVNTSSKLFFAFTWLLINAIHHWFFWLWTDVHWQHQIMLPQCFTSDGSSSIFGCVLGSLKLDLAWSHSVQICCHDELLGIFLVFFCCLVVCLFFFKYLVPCFHTKSAVKIACDTKHFNSFILFIYVLIILQCHLLLNDSQWKQATFGVHVSISTTSENMLWRAKLQTDSKNNFRNRCKVWKKEKRICLCESLHRDRTGSSALLQWLCSEIALGNVSRLN